MNTSSVYSYKMSYNVRKSVFVQLHSLISTFVVSIDQKQDSHDGAYIYIWIH